MGVMSTRARGQAVAEEPKERVPSPLGATAKAPNPRKLNPMAHAEVRRNSTWLYGPLTVHMDYQGDVKALGSVGVSGSQLCLDGPQ